jgi:hypothetical protein
MVFSRDAVWTCQFPISLAVEGEACYERMARSGIGRVLFCSVIYSPYRMLLPRYPHKGIYSMEEGRYHYLPDAKRYQGLPNAPTPYRDPATRPARVEGRNGTDRNKRDASAELSRAPVRGSRDECDARPVDIFMPR